MSAVARILITTDYLRPGDEVDDLLRSHGHEPRHRSGDLVADLAADLAGIEGARELLDALADRPKHAVNAHLIEERDNR